MAITQMVMECSILQTELVVKSKLSSVIGHIISTRSIAIWQADLTSCGEASGSQTGVFLYRVDVYKDISRCWNRLSDDDLLKFQGRNFEIKPIYWKYF